MVLTLVAAVLGSGSTSSQRRLSVERLHTEAAGLGRCVSESQECATRMVRLAQVWYTVATRAAVMYP